MLSEECWSAEQLRPWAAKLCKGWIEVGQNKHR